MLTGTVSASNRATFVLLSNQKCITQPTQPTVIDLQSNKYSQEFHYDSFEVKLDRCVGSCNTPNDLSNKVASQTKQKI